MKVYLDNAATTAIDPEVLQVMTHVLSENFGNPSSSHSEGRKSRAKLESARKSIASLFHVSSSEIVFTSGGTEANNLAIQSVLKNNEIEQVITSAVEHHAVLNTLENTCADNNVDLIRLRLNAKGEVSTEEVRMLLSSGKKTFVSLMHGNNEVGNLLPLESISNLCREYDAVFHCDTVQTVGHYLLDLSKVKIDYITCSAHKIHGPKGVGFLYVSKEAKLHPLFFGGKQERGFRPGTENIAAVCGMEKALRLAYDNLENNEAHIKGLKQQLVELLVREIEGVVINGSVDNSMSTVVSVQFNSIMDPGMLLFQMDLKGICASGGSACSSGSLKGSHVLSAIQGDVSLPTLRFSISRNTTIEEIEYAVGCLKEILEK